MKYLIRSVKTFFSFALYLVVLTALMLTFSDNGLTLQEAYLDPEVGLFRDNNLIKMLAFLILVASVYPMFSFVKKDTFVSGGYAENAAEIHQVFEKQGYIKVSEDNEKVYYRKSSGLVRLMRYFEDEVSITKLESPLVIDGMRKDVYRLASSISYICREKEE